MGTHSPIIKIENYEGPFDLMLELARSHKLDLTQVSLTKIADQFLHYLKSQRLSPEVQGDYLVVAATLLLLKARQLLPPLTGEEQEEVVELHLRLRIYQLYREQAEAVRTRWGQGRLLGPYSLTSEHDETSLPPGKMLGYSPQQLEADMTAWLARLPKPPQPKAHLTRRGKTLEECLHIFQKRLVRYQRIVFGEMVRGESRQTTAVSFLAVLEMASRNKVQLRQEVLFDTLYVQRK